MHSFRDPSGSVIHTKNSILRLINQEGLSNAEAYISSKTCQKWVEEQKLVSSTELKENRLTSFLEDPDFNKLYSQNRPAQVFLHNKIPFVSYPFEWSPSMLHAAALLTIDFALALLPDGLGLKDATPYNILFHHAQPVFVDILSVEKRSPQDSVWLPYAQFISTFILPLLVNQKFKIPLQQIFLTRREGISPEEVHKYCSFWQSLSPSFLTHVSLPTWLNSKAKTTTNLYGKHTFSPERAQFTLNYLFKRLKNTLLKLAPKQSKTSQWINYTNQLDHYTRLQVEKKQSFVTAILQQSTPKHVLDMGCNTGVFSFLAAEHGAHVVSIDYDPAVIDAIWQKARAKNLSILPLVIDISRPSPRMGWNNSEQRSFLERAQGHCDMVFMLAIIHHLLITERVPLEEIALLAYNLTSNHLIIEWIEPEDPMFRQLVRGREALYSHFSVDQFKDVFGQYFNILHHEQLPESPRWLFHMQKKL